MAVDEELTKVKSKRQKEEAPTQVGLGDAAFPYPRVGYFID